MKTFSLDKGFWPRAAFIFVMLALLYLAGPESALSVASTVVVIFLMMTYMRTRYPERYKKDERTVKIGAYAASYSWFVTFLAVAALYWLDYLGYARMPGTVALSLVFALMSASIIFFRFILSRRGDVE